MRMNTRDKQEEGDTFDKTYVGQPMSARDLVASIIRGHKKHAPPGCDCDICQGKCDYMLEEKK